jgi:low temperature requirement protein LtrA
MLDVHNLTGRAVARDDEEENRASTPLELFFDLTFVVAVGRVAGTLHDELLQGHIREGLIGFGAMLFAVVLAWMEFTWFASAHDSDDVPYRLLTFVQIAGALVFATGVTKAMTDRDFSVCVVGYVIMRVGLVTAWLRVARDVPEWRTRAVRYSVSLIGVQVLWVAWLWAPDAAIYPIFALLAALELALPFWADHRPLFHAEHIEERYGLFTLIVLGESVLSAAAGFQAV